MDNTKLFIILGNQLFNPNLYFKRINQYDFFLCEDYGLCSYVKHHKLKLLHVLSSMRLYKDELKSLGLKVHYNSIEDENFYDDTRDIKTFSRESNSYESAKQHSKRPLEAISLRQPKNLQTTEQKKLPYVKESKDEDWPDEMDFKVERWQRASEKENNTSRVQSNQQVQSKSRNLPRSRRRRV